jgi:hypothetical protein
MSYEPDIPVLGNASGDGIFIGGAQGAGSLTPAQVRELVTPKVMLVPFFLQTTGTVGLAPPGTKMGFGQPAAEGSADHKLFVMPRTGSVVGIVARINGTLAGGSMVLRPRWNGTFMTTLKCVFDLSTSTKDGGSFCVYNVDKDGTTTTVPQGAWLGIQYHTPQSKGNPGSPRTSALDVSATLLVEF